MISSAFAVDSVITSFSVTADGDKAILEWVSGIEGNLAKYSVERSADGKVFSSIHDVFPQGNTVHYRYIDENPLKFYSQRLYYYRIKMLFSDGNFTYSEIESVSLNFNGLQETWGSIKAMFR